MKQEKLTGKVQTVLGIIDADSLGITLPHEHLFLDESTYFIEPIEASEKKLAHEPVRMDNLYWVKTHWPNHWDNQGLKDEQVAIKEAMMYKLAGGSTIVELTSIGLGRDPLALARISRATGLNVVMGSGYYLGMSHPPELATKTVEEVADGIIRDIMVGVGDTGVRSGIIGEIGCSTPLEETERRVLRASAIAQQRTGAAINVHPGMADDLVLEIINILSEAGADLGRTIISHVDIFGFSRTTCHKLMDAGCYVEYDNFGYPEMLFPFNGHYIDQKSETQRINDIIQFIADGYLNQILISGDFESKYCLVTYGGFGYAHILRTIVPIMQDKGISDEQIHTILVENPKRILTFALPKE